MPEKEFPIVEQKILDRSLFTEIKTEPEIPGELFTNNFFQRTISHIYSFDGYSSKPVFSNPDGRLRTAAHIYPTPLTRPYCAIGTDIPANTTIRSHLIDIRFEKVTSANISIRATKDSAVDGFYYIEYDASLTELYTSDKWDIKGGVPFTVRAPITGGAICIFFVNGTNINTRVVMSVRWE